MRKHALRFGLPLLSLFICLPAQAYELETGPIMICDTQRQAERVAQVFNGDLNVTVDAINTEEHNPTACVIADLGYVQGPELGMARSGLHTFRIIPILVVAANSPTGYRAAEPALFFTVVKVVEYAA